MTQETREPLPWPEDFFPDLRPDFVSPDGSPVEPNARGTAAAQLYLRRKALIEFLDQISSERHLGEAARAGSDDGGFPLEEAGWPRGTQAAFADLLDAMNEEGFRLIALMLNDPQMSERVARNWPALRFVYLVACCVAWTDSIASRPK